MEKFQELIGCVYMEETKLSCRILADNLNMYIPCDLFEYVKGKCAF
jgi:hypothetical protein